MDIRRGAGFRAIGRGAVEAGVTPALQKIIEREIVAQAMFVALLRIDFLQAQDIGVERMKQRPQCGAPARKLPGPVRRPIEMFEIESREAKRIGHPGHASNLAITTISVSGAPFIFP